MAIVQVTSAPSRAAYDAVQHIVRLDRDRPAGMIVHAAAEQADGSVLMVDVWDSHAAMDAFEHDRLFPAFASMPVNPMQEPPARLEIFELVRA